MSVCSSILFKNNTITSFLPQGISQLHCSYQLDETNSSYRGLLTTAAGGSCSNTPCRGKLYYMYMVKYITCTCICNIIMYMYTSVHICWPHCDLHEQLQCSLKAMLPDHLYVIINVVLQTALKLLDGEFADEKIRSFAVHVLETLPNEQLENFLLQLTQVSI